jgi:hypothetical protein
MIDDRTEHSPTDPHWRYEGARTDYDRSPEAAAIRRRSQFATIAEFAEWRAAHGMQELSPAELENCWNQWRGITTAVESR